MQIVIKRNIYPEVYIRGFINLNKTSQVVCPGTT